MHYSYTILRSYKLGTLEILEIATAKKNHKALEALRALEDLKVKSLI